MLYWRDGKISTEIWSSGFGKRGKERERRYGKRHSKMSALVPLRRNFLKNLPLQRILIFLSFIIKDMFLKGNYFSIKIW